LALYFGFASELSNLRSKNPNLNFDVALLPQTGEKNNATFGNMYALAITKNSKNIGGSFKVIKALTNDKFLKEIASFYNLPPVSRFLLRNHPEKDYLDVFYKSAILSKAWLDPNPKETTKIFRKMIEEITTGRQQITSAVTRASSELKVLISGDN